MRNRPHLGHFALANFCCPGKRSFPNMAITPMNTKNSMTILTTTSEAKPGVIRPFFDSGHCVLRKACAEPLQKATLAPVLGKANVVAIKLFQLRHDMADAIHKPYVKGALTQPEFTGEQIFVIGQLVAPTRFY